MTDAYDSEAAIIGGLLLFPQECTRAIEELSPDDFENPLASDAFQIISAACKDGRKVDGAIFQSGEAAKEVKHFALSAAQAFLSTSNYDAYINTVRDNSGKMFTGEKRSAVCIPRRLSGK
ncbi:DnaB-like helicase N-terminal domain-containing protein [Streptococcus pneumoniae]